MGDSASEGTRRRHSHPIPRALTHDDFIGRGRVVGVPLITGGTIATISRMVDG